MNSSFIRWSLTLSLMLVTSGNANAQESSIELDADLALLTDYVFRGISRSGGEISAMGNVTLSGDGGLYGGVLLARIKDFRGHDLEAEAFVGFGTALDAYDLDFTISYDSFHGSGDSQGYVELRSYLSRDFGRLFVRSGFAYAPDNREIGLGRSVYGFGEVVIPLTIGKALPFSLEMSLGYEDFEGGFDKWDWSLGAFVDVMGFEAGIKYTDTNRNNLRRGSGRVLFSIRRYF